jgi:hypothetical protein
LNGRNVAHDGVFTSQKTSGDVPMVAGLQVLTVVAVAIAMALALAHALELPGKLRLSKEHYLAVQAIYYPGFTFGGFAEPIALLLMIILLFVMPPATPAFWMTVGAFVALSAMHATYWLMTHPVNNFWLKDFTLNKAAAGFFALNRIDRTTDDARPDWTWLRDRWEFSHVVRAGLGLLSLILLVSAIAL